MPSNTLLIEIGSEELPPKSLNQLRQSFEKLFVAALKKAQLGYGEVSSYATPRRLALTISQLDAEQPDQSIEKRGPAKKAAFDDDGLPTRALLGFMKGCGIEDSEELDTLETDKGDYVMYRSEQTGASLSTLLPDITLGVLAQLPIARRMRWGKSRAEFVRPIQWVACLYADKVIPLTIMGVEAGRKSRGHRFMSDGEFDIAHAEDYAEDCRRNKVIADFDERQALIKKQILAIAGDLQGSLELDESLLEEVTSLVEWPVALAGSFDESFLKVPPEVLISAMKEHQRYFHLVDKDAQLLPKFITVSNIESTSPETVVAGNERVIRPRLSDAAFFFNRDTKTTLANKNEKLASVVFQTELGTYASKTDRISQLASHIAQQIGADQNTAARAGLLCKADLVSDMVGEFPDLQGTMGSYYAIHDGESNDIAMAIGEHYRPTQSGGVLPDSPIGSCVSLADKLDTLVGLFGIGQPPTGSRDPFALRRQSLGIIRICVENKLDIDLSRALKSAASAYDKGFKTDAALTYIVDRLKSYYGDQGVSVDLVEAATNSATLETNLLAIDEVVKLLKTFKDGESAESIVAANKRVANILKKQDPNSLPSSIDKALLSDEAELALFEAISGLDSFDGTSTSYKFEQLQVLQAPIDRFFEDVLVMAEDPSVRQNRLALLIQVRNLYLEVADFSLLQ